MRAAMIFGLLAAATATEIPESCKVSVVGAGWGGVYFAWRLAVDTRRYKASDVCVFEANDRVGGRVYTVRDYPEMEDLEIEIGAYRFDTEDHLPADLVMDALKLDSRCYGYNCTGLSCHWYGSPTTCRKIADVYGNAQYSIGIETMLTQLRSAGAKLFRGVAVKGVHEGCGTVWRTGKKRSVLSFVGRDETVQSEVVLMNVPLTAMDLLDSDSVIFPSGGGSAEAGTCFSLKVALPAVKAYALYEDAWWYTKLGLMNGEFGLGNETIPLAGRYGDGSVKCIIGTGPDGKPVRADSAVPFGNCRGSLEVYYKSTYAGATPLPSYFWFDRATQHDDPLTRTVQGDGDDAILGELHDVLMEFHADEFAAAGVDTTTIPPPKALYMGAFLAEGTYVGAMGLTQCALTKGIDLWKTIRRPNADFDVFMANQDFGYDLNTQIGWATGSLQLAEKILQAELKMHRPHWLNSSWYEEKIVNVP
eukprot:TRINITY_DN1076_c0_g3_i1.p1 TRINITY_DN1076_c0_g3~~TRINITY_DN1076_c0_g3_i1.p1  ORF type:complete len:475 (+),score=177.95 TRINITY_DN1076_c0_g3_i1:50-1474(+)